MRYRNTKYLLKFRIFVASAAGEVNMRQTVDCHQHRGEENCDTPEVDETNQQR